MPKFKSIDGRWIPVDVVAKTELDLLGKTHLGGKAKVESVEAASIEEPTAKPLSTEEKVKKERILAKRGMVSKLKKRKAF